MLEMLSKTIRPSPEGKFVLLASLPGALSRTKRTLLGEM